MECVYPRAAVCLAFSRARLVLRPWPVEGESGAARHPEEDVQDQTSHGGGRVELLGHGDEGDACWSKVSIILAKSSSDRLRRSTL